MSHFAVLVVGDNPEKQLLPYHEFECTGEDNEYVVEVDQTERARSDYETDTESMLEAPDGSRHSWFTKEGDYKAMFLREPTDEERKKIGRVAGSGFGYGLSWVSRDFKDGKGYRTMIVSIPQGWKEIKVPSKETKTFHEWAEEEYGRQTILHDQMPDVAGAHKFGYIQLGKNGDVARVVKRTNPNAKWDWYEIGGRFEEFLKLKPSTLIGPIDQCLKADVDFEHMKAADPPLVTFAVLKDGKWYERGSMGWWGLASNEKDRGDWAREFYGLIDSISDDTLLTVVDCHI